MKNLRPILIGIFAIVSFLSFGVDATQYTRFEDLPKCGQKCLSDSIEHALKTADCGTSLYCACRSQQYSEWIYSCLGKNKPCDERAKLNDVLLYNIQYYCNETSDQRVRYTVKVAGAEKTLTMDGRDATSTSHALTGATSTMTTGKDHPTTTSGIPTGTSHTSDGESTSKSNLPSPSAAGNASSTSSHSSSTSTTTNSSTFSSEPTISSSILTSQTESVPPGMTVVDANTTIMGHTVTAKATTLVTATVNSGTGPCQIEALRRGLHENLHAMVGLSIALLSGFILFLFIVG
ncbi:hypothetical protein LTR84_003428 [Exophiala bonariae]|uniref:CFEM domain-containing protein n=1 Tax=Exophiala bonariae TaxID=1690606 RepID=A0AAV9N789_9EURO|nr:hypothetical protein LTR84_003428 [Exophiala bonariae]